MEIERILIAGDINGHINDLYTKVSKVTKTHGEFSFLLVVGSFFGDSDEQWMLYKNGIKQAPIETYTLGPNNTAQIKYYPDLKSDSTMLKLCDQVSCLGKLGVFVTSMGLTVAYLSGRESRNTSLSSFSETDILKFIEICDRNRKQKPVDVFICSQWPKNITSEIECKNPSTLLQMVVKSIIPRYIISATEGLWYKRAPYNNDEPYSNILSRFIGLGKVRTKEKWLFALELTKNYPDVKKPLHCLIPSPFKNVFFETSSSQEQYRWNLKRTNEKPDCSLSKSSKKKSKPNSDCWFCLSSPNVEKHLIISIGTDTYIALAKGGLVKDHLLISSIAHIKNYRGLYSQTKTEIALKKISISNYYKDKGFSAVFFERNLFSTVHFEIDAIPIPCNQISLVKNVFEEYAVKYELEIEWFSADSEITFPFDNWGTEDNDNLQYFCAELPTSEILLIRIQDKFPLLFPRYVLADHKLLNVADRVNWRNCTETVEEEKTISNVTRNEFKAFDVPEK